MTIFNWSEGKFSHLTPTQIQKFWLYPSPPKKKTTHPSFSVQGRVLSGDLECEGIRENKEDFMERKSSRTYCQMTSTRKKRNEKVRRRLALIEKKMGEGMHSLT